MENQNIETGADTKIVGKGVHFERIRRRRQNHWLSLNSWAQ